MRFDSSVEDLGGSGSSVVRSIFLVFILPVQNKFRCDARQKLVNETSDLSASDDLGIDKVTVKVEDQINNLGGVHSLLNVRSQSDLINAKLISLALNSVLKTEFCRLVLDAKVHRNDDCARRERSEGFDGLLRTRVDAAVVVQQAVCGSVCVVIHHHKVILRAFSSWCASLWVRSVG